MATTGNGGTKLLLPVGLVLSLLSGALFLGRSLQRVEDDLRYLAQDQVTIYRRLEEIEHEFRKHNREAERWKERIEQNANQLNRYHGKH